MNQSTKNTKIDNTIPNPERRISLESYVVGFARAASQAQRILNSEQSPMVIKEAEFKVNISTDLRMDKNSMINIRADSASPAVKALMNYKEHFGLDMRFVMVPPSSLLQINQEEEE